MRLSDMDITNEEGIKLLDSLRFKVMNQEASEDERNLFFNYVNYLGLLSVEIEKTAPEIMEAAVNKVLGTLPIFKYSETTPENEIIN